MARQTNDESESETRETRRTALVLPALGVCWLAFIAYSELYSGQVNLNYAAMTLGVGLMIAGVVRFLSASSERSADGIEVDVDGEPDGRIDGRPDGGLGD